MRVPTSDPHTINACWFLFLLFVYLLVAEAASFDKKELCRSDTIIVDFACGFSFLFDFFYVVNYFLMLALFLSNVAYFVFRFF